MKIATHNINNITKRLDNLLSCIEAIGDRAVWRGERSRNGVAILSKKDPVITARRLQGDFNMVPDLKMDIYPTRSWNGALTQPSPDNAFKSF